MCAKHAAWIMMLLILVVASPPASAQSTAQVSQVRDGTIVAIDRSSGTVIIEYAVAGQSAEQLVVLVQDFTRLSVTEADGERTASIATLQVGDKIVVEGLRLNDGRFVATVVKATRGALGTSPPPATQSGAATTSQPTGSGPAPRPEPDSGTQSNGSLVQLKGVVTARDSSGLIVADIAGARRRVTLMGNVRVEGQRDSMSAVLPRDFIVVEGTLNADGSLAARSIEVVLAARNVITGRITAIGNGFVVLDGNRTVPVTAGTLVLVNGELRSIADLRVGAEVTVSGVTDTAGGVGGSAASGAVEAAGGATGGGPVGSVGTIIDAVIR